MATKRDTRAPKVRKDGQTNRHELAIRVLVRSHPDIHRNGFKEAVRALYQGSSFGEAPRMDFLPDAYRLCRETQTLILYEVEDSNPISPDKLYRLAEFWFDMDSDSPDDWLPELRTVDRYGRETGTIDLAAIFYCGVLEDIQPGSVNLKPATPINRSAAGRGKL